jgi:hypothetical protein
VSEILRFLVEHCAFLYDTYRYRFVDSETTREFGGNAYLVLESPHLRLRFVRDRGPLFLDVQAKEGPRDWFSIDLVWTLLGNEPRASAQLDEDYVDFLRQNLEQIETAFSGEHLPQTMTTMRRLQRERAKRMFD